MKWIIELLFPTLRGRAVKIRRDHLPGLKPPKASPFSPKRTDQGERYKGPSLDEYYERFKASGSGKAKRRRPDDGMGF
jgi:hypothetical protein